MEDWTVCIMRGGFISSVTTGEPDVCKHAVRQYRGSGLKVRVFKTRQAYEEFAKKDYEEHIRQTMMQRECMFA